jgi:hypothetical protein
MLRVVCFGTIASLRATDSIKKDEVAAVEHSSGCFPVLLIL